MTRNYRREPDNNNRAMLYLVAVVSLLISMCWWLVNLPNLIQGIVPR